MAATMAAMPTYEGRRRADRPASDHGHGHGHGHAHGPVPDLVVARVPRLVLLGVLALVGVVVVVGVLVLWPDGAKVRALQGQAAFAAPGVTFPHGRVTHVQPACPPDRQDQTCGHLEVSVEGTSASVSVAPEVSDSGLGPGDQVQLQRSPGSNGGAPTYAFYKTDRGGGMWLLVAIFALVVVAVARLRGLLAMIALGIGVLVIGLWLLPSLLSGHDPVAAALVAAALILYVVLYLTHGLSMRTSAALAGTLGGVGATALLGLLFTGLTHLSGVGDEGGTLLTSLGSGIDFQGLMTATVIIAGLGVLNDVTITQASAVWELRAASSSLNRRQLWSSAMRIGRDHIASTIYTIVFAYAGTALLTLLVVRLYDRPLRETLGTESMAEEIVRSLVSAVGLVLAVPITTAVATALVPHPAAREPGR